MVGGIIKIFFLPKVCSRHSYIIFHPLLMRVYMCGLLTSALAMTVTMPVKMPSCFFGQCVIFKLLPEKKKNEILNRLKEPLRDLSISRRSFSWGIPFPLDKNHVWYVWFDALTNYLTTIGYPTERYKTFWPANIHLIGVDIVWHHTVIWPTILMAAGIKPPKTVFVHGFINAEGGVKMSKSLGNYIGVAEPPNEIYGKVMSIPDSLIMDYFALVTDVPDEELAEFRRELTDQIINPMVLKKRLAREIVTQLYDEKAAIDAEEHFAKVIQKKELPEEIENLPLNLYFKDLPPEQIEFTSVDISQLLVVTGKVKSRSEANRLIEQGAISIDGKKLTGPTASIKIGSVIKVGKRRFARVINTDR